ncbi:TIGR02281 family clan AA aspartic protease [Rhodobacteraceae bacterium nBUS_24]
MSQVIDYPRLVYLGLLAAVLLGSVLMTRRGAFKKAAFQGGIWLVIFAAMIAAVGIWQDIRSPQRSASSFTTQEGNVVISQGGDGHYRVKVKVNDQTLSFLVDTGASHVVLTQSDAKALGFKLENLQFWNTARTANGPVSTAPVRLRQMALGPYVDRNVSASVNSGEMQQSLLGMSYLNLYSSIEISQKKMVLKR